MSMKDGIKWCPGCCQPMYNSRCWCRLCHKDVVRQMHNRPLPAKSPPFEDVSTCEFHVFFIHIQETREHIELLRKPEPGENSRIATPKITTSNLKTIKPIDRTAARVV